MLLILKIWRSISTCCVRFFISLILTTIPKYIYNMDETGVPPLEQKPPKVIARKGQKKIHYCTSGQKAQITVSPYSGKLSREKTFLNQ